MKEEFKVGDEVKDRYMPSVKGIIYDINDNFAEIIGTFNDGSLYPLSIGLESCKKTGRHFDQIDALINSVELIHHFLNEDTEDEA